MNPMDVVVPKTVDDAPHEEVPYFFATKEGWYKNMPTLFGVAQVQSNEGPPHMEEWKPTFMLNDLKMPKWVLSQAHDFFRHIWNTQKAESSVYILYNRKKNTFKLFAPEQYVTGSSVNHRLDRSKLPEGYSPVGTIHSHCNFSAFHSGTDVDDMAKMPGLHITIGHVERETPEMVFALSVGDQSFDVKREQIIDEEAEVNEHGYDTMPPYWPAFVKHGNAPWGSSGITTSHSSHRYTGYYKPAKTHTSPSDGGWRKINGGELQRRWDWQAWDDDYCTQESLLPELETKTTDGYHYEADGPFEKNSDIIELAVEQMMDITAWLNSYGFSMEYSLMYNEGKAKAQLAAYNERMAQDDAPTA